MVTIRIDPYGANDEKIFEYESITIQSESLNILVGCNGSGKTTLMNKIQSYINRENHEPSIVARFFRCCDTMTVVDRLIGFSSSHDDIVMGSTILTSSEGERMAIALKTAFDWMWCQCKQSSISAIVLLLDSLDSGIDIPTIRMILRVLEETITIAKTQFNVDLYVVISANSFAMVENRDCIDVNINKIVHFDNWNQYADFCEDSNARKQARST